MEDEPLARWVALKALEEIGADVLEADSCTEARRLLDTYRVDLLILDYRLPDGVGTSVAEYARQAEFHGPIVLLSADADDFTANASPVAFSAVLSKPLNVEELQTTVRSLFQSMEKPAESSEPGGPREETAWADRFRLITMPERLTPTELAPITCTPADKGWIALDLRATTDVSADCLPLLNTLAEQCLAQGGRLALLSGTPAIIHADEQGSDRLYDLLPDPRALEALSRRLSSFCERSFLLASVIPRDTEAMPSP